MIGWEFNMLQNFRPYYHFTPTENWMNDPNGMIFHNGYYNLYYQYHPESAVWGPMHWGHAVSRDLINWEHLPIAIFPDHNGMIFSGSVVYDKENTSGLFNDGGGLVAIYTQHLERDGQMPLQQQSIAYSLDEGLSYIPYPGNPIIKNTVIEHYRDPKVFWYQPSNRWVMVMAGGVVRIFTSANLIDWRLESEYPEYFSECPDLFPLTDELGNEHWVLNLGGVSYVIGSFDGSHFYANTPIIPLNYGPDCYSTMSFNNAPMGRVIMLNCMTSFKLPNWGYAAVTPTYPWRTAMTVPVELGLKTLVTGNFVMTQRPVKEVTDYFEKTLINQSFNMAQGETRKISTDEGPKRIILEADICSDGILSLSILNHDEFSTQVVCDMKSGSLILNRKNSGLTDFHPAFADEYKAPLIHNNGLIHLEILIDACSVEVFCGEISCITCLVFPAKESCDLILHTDKPCRSIELLVSQPSKQK